jgi:putative transposase
MLFQQPEVRDVIETAWAEIPRHFPGVSVDVFVVMPNHIHGILVLSEAEAHIVAS